MAADPSVGPWAEFVRELGKHGPDGLVIVGLFALVVFAVVYGASGWLIIPALLICCGAYDRRRSKAEAHAVRMAELPVREEEARIARIKDPYRPLTGEQTSLDLERKPRRLVSRRKHEA
jgi:hypothetical protein